MPPARALLPLALLLWGIFLVAESTFRLFDLYRSFSLIDVPSHFLAGAALGATALWAFVRLDRTRWVWWSSLGAVVLLSLGWEALEMLEEAVSPDPPHFQDHFVWDGVVDVLVSGAGGAVFLEWVRRRRARSTVDESSEPPGGGV